jgi:hypothetical protein
MVYIFYLQIMVRIVDWLELSRSAGESIRLADAHPRRV